MSKNCRVPIIFRTVGMGAAVDIEAMNAGALDYLVKGEINLRMPERSLRYALKRGDTLGELRPPRDPLTGLLNRRVFDRILREEMERSQRLGLPFSLLLIDIDYFKNVNDRDGHFVGNLALKEVAKRL